MLISEAHHTPVAQFALVHILADDLGYNDVSWHNPVMKTPVLQQLLDKGVRLKGMHTWKARRLWSPDLCPPVEPTSVHQYMFLFQRCHMHGVGWGGFSHSALVRNHQNAQLTI